MINVTKPYTPDQRLFLNYIDQIWNSKWFTNNGPLVRELEVKVGNEFEINHVLLTSNGTIALQMAIKALDLKNEIITTPFSFVASTSSIVWEGCEPVFVDIDPQTLNIDASKIEQAITPQTTAILATHVYGNPCDVEMIQEIANKHNLKVIYDGAHTFGVRYKGKSLFQWGDISTCSFHATKIFHTVEGGAVFTKSDDIAYRLARIRNFGFKSFDEFDGIGINGKNSEFHAAMGLSILPDMPSIIQRRKELASEYDRKLNGLGLTKPSIFPGTDYNYSYYVVIFNSEKDLIQSKDALEQRKIFSRRYFYPLLSSLDYVKPADVPIAEDISKRVLCLPFYYDLSFDDIDIIAGILNKKT